MSNRIYIFTALLAFLCLIIIVGHEYDIEVFDPAKYPVMNWVLAVAYSYIILSVLGVTAILCWRGWRGGRTGK